MKFTNFLLPPVDDRDNFHDHTIDAKAPDAFEQDVRTRDMGYFLPPDFTDDPDENITWIEPGGQSASTVGTHDEQPCLTSRSLRLGERKAKKEPPKPPAKPREAEVDTSKIRQLFDLLTPKVSGKLIFSDGEAYLQSEERGNTFLRSDKTAVIDWMRLLLPESKRSSFRTHDLLEVMAIFRAEFNVGPAEDAFNNHPGLVNARNGVVRVDDGTPYLIDDQPKVRFTYFVDADFVSSKRTLFTPALDYFWRTSLGGDPDKLTQLLEFLGYALSDTTDGKVIMFLAGVSNSGKSVVCRWLNRVLRFGDVTNFPLHEVGNTFNGQQLCAAKLNISAEVDAKPLKVDAMLKSLSGGGDRITAGRKFCDGRSMVPRTKLLCAANALPQLQTGDPSDAIFNRLEVLPFSCKIEGHDLDMSLLDKLLDERSEIFTEAMYALASLITRNFRFTRSAEAVVYLDNYRHSANSFLAFEANCLVYGSEESFGRAKLFRAYQDFCSSAHLVPLGKGEFRNYLFARQGVHERLLWKDGVQVRCYVGVALRREA